MATPPYIVELRRFHGHALLLLPGVSAVVFRGSELLLVRRRDTGRWSLPAGIVEPGEQPAACLAREVWEETRVEISVDRLALLVMDPEKQYANGDRCQFLSMAFRCRYRAGEAAVGDEESLEVRWFPLAALPPLGGRDRRRVACATPVEGEAVFDR